MTNVHAKWSNYYTYCDAPIERGLSVVQVDQPQRVTCARCRDVIALARAAGGPMTGRGSPEAVFESSYDSMVNRYTDLFTPEYEAIMKELAELEGDGAVPEGAGRRRARVLRSRLKQMFHDVPCRCDCEDMPCDCRRCWGTRSNASSLADLNRRGTPVPVIAPVEPPAPDGPPASRARHRRLAAKLYLMAGLDGEAFNTWIINETARDIEFTEFTGEFGPGASMSGVRRPARTVPARSAMLFEEDYYYGLDWSVWWEVVIVARDGAVLTFRASRGKYGYSDESLYEPIPYTDKRGMRIAFTHQAA